MSTTGTAAGPELPGTGVLTLGLCVHYAATYDEDQFMRVETDAVDHPAE